MLAAERVKGRPGEVVRVPVPAPEGLPSTPAPVGTGATRPADLRKAAAALARVCRGRRTLATSVGAGAGPDAVRALVEGLLLGGYTLPAGGTKDRSDAAAVAQIALPGRYPHADVERGRVLAGATRLARDLANTPSNIKQPQWLAEQAAQVAGSSGLDVEVWDVDRLVAGVRRVARGCRIMAEPDRQSTFIGVCECVAATPCRCHAVVCTLIGYSFTQRRSG